MASLPDIRKTPDEVRKIVCDLTPFLPSAATVSAIAVAAVGDVTAALSGDAGTKPTIELTGGTEGTFSTVTLTATVDDGETIARSFRVLVRKYL